MKHLMILNGPNLNMLGAREPEIYGTDTLDDIEAMCVAHAQKSGTGITFKQTNHEGILVDWIQDVFMIQNQEDGYHGLIINAAAYTHTSLAIHDALKLLTVPIIEVHLSNPHEREDFRHHSFIAPLASKIIVGKGAQGYIEAIDALL